MDSSVFTKETQLPECGIVFRLVRSVVPLDIAGEAVSIGGKAQQTACFPTAFGSLL